MSDKETIEQLCKLLLMNRQNLDHALFRVVAQGGEQHVNAGLMHEIRSCRREIARLKHELRTRGYAITDEPNDTPEAHPDAGLRQQLIDIPTTPGAVTQGVIADISTRVAESPVDALALATGLGVCLGLLLILRALAASLVSVAILWIYQLIALVFQIGFLLIIFSFFLSLLLPRGSHKLIRDVITAFLRAAAWALLLPLSALSRLIPRSVPHRTNKVATVLLQINNKQSSKVTQVLFITDQAPNDIRVGDGAIVFGHSQPNGDVRANELHIISAKSRLKRVLYSRRSWPLALPLVAWAFAIGAAFMTGGVNTLLPFINSTPTAVVSTPDPANALPSNTAPSVATTAGATPSTTEPRRARVAGLGGVNLRVRSTPSTNAAIVDRLPENTLVELVSEPQDNNGTTWQQIRSPRSTGWVDTRYLRQEP